MITLTPADKRQIARWRDTGKSWDWIARKMGCGVTGLRGAYDPAFKERRNALSRATRNNEKRPAGSGRGQYERPIPDREVQAGRAWLNWPDTRDAGAILLGDPRPGRSAWDRAEDAKRDRLRRGLVTRSMADHAPTLLPARTGMRDRSAFEAPAVPAGGGAV